MLTILGYSSSYIQFIFHLKIDMGFKIVTKNAVIRLNFYI